MRKDGRTLLENKKMDANTGGGGGALKKIQTEEKAPVFAPLLCDPGWFRETEEIRCTVLIPEYAAK